ncbi:PIG-L family deacetylase [candidate division KSB1 bacterium]|nr:PIG-L family deacetylase [candidate division KSB1 bacterium]
MKIKVSYPWLCWILLGCLIAGMASACGPENSDGKLNIIVFGAHPDDCELKVGGMAAKWVAEGHCVKFVSTTNGDIGHATMAGGPLARRRTAEVESAAKILGIETEVLDIHDGEIMPTLENRRTFVRLIREWNADIVIGHRPNDYHPDHRYTGILMQDAAFMVTVAHFCPGTPYLKKNPVFLFMSDGFQKPYPFEPDVVVSIDDVFSIKQDAIWQLESQIESLWATGGFSDVVPVPQDPVKRAERRKAQDERLANRDGGVAYRFRDKLIELYGKNKGKEIKYAEAFEVCEYGRQPESDELMQIFMIEK